MLLVTETSVSKCMEIQKTKKKKRTTLLFGGDNKNKNRTGGTKCTTYVRTCFVFRGSYGLVFFVDTRERERREGRKSVAKYRNEKRNQQN